MKATLLARSSSGDSYKVEFSVDGEFIRVFCHCRAGLLQQMCKHKLALITGDAKMLFDSAQASVLTEIQSWPQFPRLKAQVEQYVRELGKIEFAKAELARQERVIKTQIGRDLAHGGYVA